MSAIAHMLLDQGHTVSGSDMSANAQTVALAGRGATIYAGHDATYVDGAGTVVATSAAAPDHVELEAARAAGIPLLKRQDLWRDWSQQRTVVAVAGTHGKTTTTALLALLLSRAGRDPGFLIGSVPADLPTGARWGDVAAPLVIEADEYDRAFLALTPHIAIITNVEWDHPDIYASPDEYDDAFAAFVAECEGPILTCGDDGVGRWAQAAYERDLPVITYGLAESNDYQAVLVEDQNPTQFRVRRSKVLPAVVHTGKPVSPDNVYQLSVPGLHNIRNALAVLAVADIFGLDDELVAETLRAFRGTARRFELKGEAGGVTVIDDYAHHPTEVRATLAAARHRYGGRRIVAYVQPHTYSRTSALLEEWPGAFADADVVLVGAIYAAREQDSDGAHARMAEAVTGRIARQHPDVTYVGDVAAATAAARRLLRPGDVLLTLGAGDGNRVGAAVLEQVEPV